jgi:hypothetical protein
MVTSQVTQKHRLPLTNMSSKLYYCKCFVTKNKKTEEYGYGLSWNYVRKEVVKHYKAGADAVELEMITKQEFYDGLPKP